MTINEIISLIRVLRNEIENGIDVEFNKQWIKALQNSMRKAAEKL